MNKHERVSCGGRREWLRTAGRWTLLGGLGAMTAGLLLRPRAAHCHRDLACRECSLVSGCDWPAAVEWRQADVSRGEGG